MQKEVKLKLNIRKAEVRTIKFLPLILALISLSNIILSYLGYDIVSLSYIGGVSIITLLFLYLSSYSFGFCKWHRLCLHYVTANWIINIIDLYIGIPLNNRYMFCVYFSLAGIFLILILLSIFVPWRKLCSQH